MRMKIFYFFQALPSELWAELKSRGQEQPNLSVESQRSGEIFSEGQWSRERGTDGVEDDLPRSGSNSEDGERRERGRGGSGHGEGREDQCADNNGGLGDGEWGDEQHSVENSLRKTLRMRRPPELGADTRAKKTLSQQVKVQH